MDANIDTLLPSAKDCLAKLALARAEEAKKRQLARARAEQKQREIIDQLRKPSGTVSYTHLTLPTILRV